MTGVNNTTLRALVLLYSFCIPFVFKYLQIIESLRNKYISGDLNNNLKTLITDHTQSMVRDCSQDNWSQLPPSVGLRFLLNQKISMQQKTKKEVNQKQPINIKIND